MPVLATKLFIAAPRLQAVSRPRLIERLQEGLQPGRRLTLVARPAGFGQTTVPVFGQTTVPVFGSIGETAMIF